jgi:hypothetical protein
MPVGGSLQTRSGWKGTTQLLSPGGKTTPISFVSAGGGGVILITDIAHGYASGQTIYIAGVQGTVEANGTWTITVVNPNQFSLNGSTFANPYAGGGTASPLAQAAGMQQGLLQASFSEPETYSIMFDLGVAGILPIPTPSQGPPPSIVQPYASNLGVRAIAYISWKVEGVPVQRVVDVGSGVTVSGVSQSVDVAVQDQTWTVSGPAGFQYSVSCTVSKGLRPSTNRPPSLWAGTDPALQYGVGVLGPSPTSRSIPVPVGFGITSVEVTAIGNPLADVASTALKVVHQIGSTFNKSYLITNGDLGYITMAPGTTNIVLVNASANDVIYSVSWGIDG